MKMNDEIAGWVDDKKRNLAREVIELADVHRFDFIRDICRRAQIAPFSFAEPYLGLFIDNFVNREIEKLELLHIKLLTNAIAVTGKKNAGKLLDEPEIAGVISGYEEGMQMRLNSGLNEARQQAIGLSEYIWRTQGDDKVRSSHSSKDGMKYSWGSGSIPGGEYNCRCWAEPVVSKGFEVVDSEDFMNDATPDSYLRKYPKPMVGKLIPVADMHGNVPDKVNIFIGGAGDQTENHAVEDSHSLHREVPGNNFYFTHEDRNKINDFIKEVPTGVEINIIGHSWGGDTAARVVMDNSNKINMLVTVDPVTTFDYAPDFSTLSQSVPTWVNINSIGNDNTSLFEGWLEGNFVAGSGDWGEDPKISADRFINVPRNHSDFDGLFRYGLKLEFGRQVGRY